MAWTDGIPDEDNNWDNDLAVISENFAVIKSLFAGASAPSNPVAGQPWPDLTNHLLKIRNEANNAWLSMWDLANNKPVITNLSDEITAAMIASSAKDPAVNVAGLRTLGTGAQQACAGNDDRLGVVTGDRLGVLAAGTEITIGSATTERTITETTYTEKKRLDPIKRAGTVRIYFTLVVQGAQYGFTIYGQIYFNNVAEGIERTVTYTGEAGGTTVFTEDIEVAYGDVIQVYCKKNGTAVSAKVKDVYVKALDPYLSREVSGY